MRKATIWFAVLVVLLSGCAIEKTYSPKQPDNIKQIEIINIIRWFGYTPGSDYEFEVVREIPEEDYGSFLDGLSNVPCHSYYGAPYDGFEDDTIRITYIDGSFELISEKSVYYETADGKWTYPAYDFEQEAFESFLSSWKAIYRYGSEE